MFFQHASSVEHSSKIILSNGVNLILWKERREIIYSVLNFSAFSIRYSGERARRAVLWLKRRRRQRKQKGLRSLRTLHVNLLSAFSDSFEAPPRKKEKRKGVQTSHSAGAQHGRSTGDTAHGAGCASSETSRFCPLFIAGGKRSFENSKAALVAIGARGRATGSGCRRAPRPAAGPLAPRRAPKAAKNEQ